MYHQDSVATYYLSFGQDSRVVYVSAHSPLLALAQGSATARANGLRAAATEIRVKRDGEWVRLQGVV